MALERATVPDVVLLSAPEPASAVLTVPACNANVPEDDNVPFCSVHR